MPGVLGMRLTKMLGHDLAGAGKAARDDLFLRASGLVAVSSYSTVALLDAMLTAARCTPAIRPSCFSTA